MDNELPPPSESDYSKSQLGTDNLEIRNSLLDYIDPNWEYSQVYESLLYLQGQLAITTVLLGVQECATKHSQANLAMHLEWLSIALQSSQERLREVGKRFDHQDNSRVS